MNQFTPKQDVQLRLKIVIKFYVPDIQVAEECVFSGDETRRILTLLEKLPSMN